MPTTSEAFVTPHVLRWARERANTTTTRLAKKLNIKPESIVSWESGESKPSLRQAEKLAQKLHVPFAYFFLPAPPKDQIPLPDFRTTGNTVFQKPSADFLDLLNDVVAKHAWYRGLLQNEGRQELQFVASFGIDDRFDAIASNIGDTLGITETFRQSCDSWQQFLSRAIDRVQAVGILVMRAGTVAGNTHRPVSTEEFRGVAISDKLAPLIFINASDFQAAQIFTLAHELAHIWLGTTGISNENLKEPDPSEIEKLCDAIAAELLTPKAAFLKHWRESHEDVGRLARHFRVSTLVVLRRARDLSQISHDDFQRRFDAEKGKYRRRQQAGGDFYSTLLARNSAVFTAAVIAAVNEDRGLFSEAATLLNVRVPTVQKIANYLANKAPTEAGS